MNAKQAERMMKVIDGMQMNMTMSDFERIFGEDLGEHICRKFNDPKNQGYHNLAALTHLLDLSAQSLMAHEINQVYILCETGKSPLEALEHLMDVYIGWQQIKENKVVWQ